MPTSIPPFTTVPAPGDGVKSAWAQQLTQYAVDHVNDASEAHPATAISFNPTGAIAATTVQAAIVEVAADADAGSDALSDALNAHLSDTADAHDASAISFAPVGTIAATDVQTALAEVAAEAGIASSVALTSNTTFPLGEPDQVKIVAIKVGNRVLPFMIPEHGRPAILPPASWSHSEVVPFVVGSFPSGIGTPSMTTVGTAGTGYIPRYPEDTRTLHTLSRRAQYSVDASSGAAVAGGYGGGTMIWPDSGFAGGFIASQRWGPASVNPRAFCGFSEITLPPTDSSPYNQELSWGMGWDVGDTNIQMMHNGVTTATKIDLGANFPVPITGETEYYELISYIPYGVSELNWMVINHKNHAVQTGAATDDLPHAGSQMRLRMWAAAGGVGIPIMSISLFGFDMWTA